MPRFARALLTGVALLGATVATPAAADSPKPAGGWKFEVSPYFWLAGISGDIELQSRLGGGGSISVGVDQKFGDIFQDISAIPFMGMIEASYDRFTLIGDILYLQVESEASTPGPAFGGAEVRLTNTIGSLVGTYRAVEDRRYSLEFGGGFRVWSFSTRAALTPGLLSGGVAEKSATWVDPILAGRLRGRLTDRLALSLYGDVGGFGVGSEFAWQVTGTLDYAPTDWLELKLGYRYLSVDYEGDRARYDLNFHGPFLAASFKF